MVFNGFFRKDFPGVQFPGIDSWMSWWKLGSMGQLTPQYTNHLYGDPNLLIRSPLIRPLPSRDIRWYLAAKIRIQCFGTPSSKGT